MHSGHATFRATVVELVGQCPDRGQLKTEFPELEDEDIEQALVFAAANLDDKIIPLRPAG